MRLWVGSDYACISSSQIVSIWKHSSVFLQRGWHLWPRLSCVQSGWKEIYSLSNVSQRKPESWGWKLSDSANGMQTMLIIINLIIWLISWARRKYDSVRIGGKQPRITRCHQAVKQSNEDKSFRGCNIFLGIWNASQCRRICCRVIWSKWCGIHQQSWHF